MSRDTAYRHPVDPGRRAWSLLVGALVLVVLIAAPWWAGRADMRLMGEIFLYLALASLWNLMAGYAGLVSVGQQAYVGFGGYMLFALTMFAGLPPARRHRRWRGCWAR